MCTPSLSFIFLSYVQGCDVKACSHSAQEVQMATSWTVAATGLKFFDFSVFDGKNRLLQLEIMNGSDIGPTAKIKIRRCKDQNRETIYLIANYTALKEFTLLLKDSFLSVSFANSTVARVKIYGWHLMMLQGGFTVPANTTREALWYAGYSIQSANATSPVSGSSNVTCSQVFYVYHCNEILYV